MGEKAPWLERKRAYLAHLVEAPIPVLRVVCADKLHNVQAIAKDLRNHGVAVFERFRGDREGTLWYYRSIARLFGALIQDEPGLDPGLRAMIRELRESVAQAGSLIGKYGLPLESSLSFQLVQFRGLAGGRPRGLNGRGRLHGVNDWLVPHPGELGEV